MIVERAPDRVVVVERHGIDDSQIVNGASHIVGIFFEGEFRRVNAQHHEAMVLVLGGPGLDVGQRPQAVDARVGPEIDQHDLAARGIGRECGGIQPGRGPVQRGRSSLHRQGRRGAGSPQQPRGDAQQQRRQQARFRCAGSGRGQTVAERDEGPRHPVGEAPRQERGREGAQQHQGEHERQYRQNARADDGQYPCQEDHDQQCAHARAVKCRATEFMQ